MLVRRRMPYMQRLVGMVPGGCGNERMKWLRLTLNVYVRGPVADNMGNGPLSALVQGWVVGSGISDRRGVQVVELVREGRKRQCAAICLLRGRRGGMVVLRYFLTTGAGARCRAGWHGAVGILFAPLGRR